MIHQFDSPFVFHTQVDNHQQIKQILLPKIQQDIPNYSSSQNTFSSYHHLPPDYITNDILNDIIWNPFKQLSTEHQFNPPIQNISLTGLWWNYYSQHGYTDPHSHRSDDFSFIYLLHLTDINTTVFQLMSDDCSHYPLTNKPYETEHITEGNVIIFPSFITHWARPCNNERAVIVGNITVDF